MREMSVSPRKTLEALSPDQARLLHMLLQQDTEKKQRITPFPRPVDVESFRAPTSWAQQRLWFVDHLEGQSTAYHFAIGVRLDGALDESVLRRSLDAIVDRHEVLRTGFVLENGVPLQQIAARELFPLVSFDLRG